MVLGELDIISISIGGNFNITSSGLEHFFDCTSPTDETVSMTSSSSSNKVRPPKKAHIKHYLSSIREVNISGLPITDAIFQSMCLYCPHLTSLSVSYSQASVINEESLVSMLKAYNTTLERLEIAWLGCASLGGKFGGDSQASTSVISITDLSLDFLFSLAIDCKRLQYLDICGMKCFNISNIQRMIDTRQNLVDNIVMEGVEYQGGLVGGDSGDGGINDSGEPWVPFTYINMKFVSNPLGSIAHLDNMITANPNIKLIV